MCTQLDVLVAQAGSNFIEHPAGAIVIETLPDAQKCTLVQSLSGAKAYHCAWKFPYRDDAANVAFESVNQMIRDCFAGSSESVKDASVNHPDTYYQRQHILDQIVISVSIKDKIALQETYVFVGFHGATDD